MLPYQVVDAILTRVNYWPMKVLFTSLSKTSVCGGSLALFYVHIHMQYVRLLLSLETLYVARNCLERFLVIIPVQGVVQMHEITVFLTSLRGSV
jgi:hypothetical protein